MSNGRSPGPVSPGPSIEISVESALWGAVDLDPLIDAAVAAALEETGAAILPGAELSFLFCDDAAIRVLNRDWRRIDKPTNVLSFPAVDPERIASSPALGDIAIAFETTRREALEEGKTIEDHVSHLIVHGVLHLLGYDHESDGEAEEMEAIERRALGRIGVADPYAGAGLIDAQGEPAEQKS